MASESTPEWPDDEVLPAIHPEGLEPSGGTTPAEEPSKIAADPTHGISSNGNGYHAKSDAVSGKKAGGDKKRGTSPREGGGTQKGGKARGASKQKGGGHERSASSGSLNGRQGEAVAAGSEEGKKSSSWKDRKVLIVFEVDMGDGRIEKIELREGQKLRPGVRAFCRNHGLDIDTTAPRLEAHLREKAPPGKVTIFSFSIRNDNAILHHDDSFILHIYSCHT